jgi:outer membrane protein OmpA-like peptidoglycan-associated protein
MKTFKPSFVLLLIIYFSNTSFCQNLIINGSFEDHYLCNNPPLTERPYGWYNIAKTATYGYYSNIPGSTGNWNLDLIIGSNFREFRNYWETTLLQKLDKGKKYKIKLSLASTFGEGPNLNDIGFYFTNKMIFTSQLDTMLQPSSYINFRGSKLVKTKILWFTIEKVFTAQNNDQVLIVGNFSGKDYQKIVFDRNRNSKYLSIHIDDIEISPLDKFTCTECEKIKDSLYMESKSEICTEIPTIPDSTILKYAAEHKSDTIRLGTDILFSSNSYSLTQPESLEALRSVLTQPDIRKIKIIGYSDSTGTTEFNKDLSFKRARSVGQYLVNEFHIPASKIEETGFGISTRYSDIKMNRRVEIIIYKE